MVTVHGCDLHLKPFATLKTFYSNISPRKHCGWERCFTSSMSAMTMTESDLSWCPECSLAQIKCETVKASREEPFWTSVWWQLDSGVTVTTCRLRHLGSLHAGCWHSRQILIGQLVGASRSIDREAHFPDCFQTSHFKSVSRNFPVNTHTCWYESSVQQPDNVQVSPHHPRQPANRKKSWTCCTWVGCTLLMTTCVCLFWTVWCKNGRTPDSRCLCCWLHGCFLLRWMNFRFPCFSTDDHVKVCLTDNSPVWPQNHLRRISIDSLWLAVTMVTLLVCNILLLLAWAH